MTKTARLTMFHNLDKAPVNQSTSFRPLRLTSIPLYFPEAPLHFCSSERPSHDGILRAPLSLYSTISVLHHSSHQMGGLPYHVADCLELTSSQHFTMPLPPPLLYSVQSGSWPSIPRGCSSNGHWARFVSEARHSAARGPLS